MRLLPAFNFCLSLALLGATTLARGDEQLDLAAVLKRAEQLNSAVLTGREAAVQAHSFADSQRVALLPNVALKVQQQRLETVTVTTTTKTQNTPAGRYDGQLNGSLNLLNLQQIAAYRSALRGAAAADEDAEFTLQSILAITGSFYFTQLRNQARDLVLAANVVRAQELLTLAKNMLSAGVIVTQIDVTRAEATLAQARLAQLQNETTTKQGAQLLMLSLDYDVMQPVTLKSLNLVPSTIESTASTLAARNLVEAKYFARRADWRRTQRSLEQAHFDEKSASFERAPSLALTGSYGDAAQYFDTHGKLDEWSAALSLSVPIFDGLKSSADRRTALSRRRVQEIKLRALENQIKAEIDLAEQNANSSYQQIDVAQQNLRLAQDQLRLAKQRFEQGVADNREVVDAQNQLAVAEDNAIEARYRYNLSRVELARAKGDVRDLLTEKTE